MMTNYAIFYLISICLILVVMSKFGKCFKRRSIIVVTRFYIFIKKSGGGSESKFEDEFQRLVPFGGVGFKYVWRFYIHSRLYVLYGGYYFFIDLHSLLVKMSPVRMSLLVCTEGAILHFLRVIRRKDDSCI